MSPAGRHVLVRAQLPHPGPAASHLLVCPQVSSLAVPVGPDIGPASFDRLIRRPNMPRDARPDDDPLRAWGEAACFEALRRCVRRVPGGGGVGLDSRQRAAVAENVRISQHLSLPCRSARPTFPGATDFYSVAPCAVVVSPTTEPSMLDRRHCRAHAGPCIAVQRDEPAWPRPPASGQKAPACLENLAVFRSG